MRYKVKLLILVALLLLCSCGPVGVIPMMAAAFTGKSGGDDNNLPASEHRAWVEKFPLTSPSARYGHAMTYNSTHEVTVLFGGKAEFHEDDTWEWDGIDWIQKFSTEKPLVRRGHAMAYDSIREIVVLFGGISASSYLNDTWEWDGNNWVDVSPIGTEGVDFPSLRQTHAMVYDFTRGVIVLFGGYYYDGAHINYNDTWEWDGINWTEKFPVDSPSPRRSHTMVCDSKRGVIVLFGGYNDVENLNDTWEWDGINWTYKSSTDVPFPRFWHSTTYDSKRGQVVLFGGCHYDGAYTYYDDTWSWDGVDWTQQFPENNPSGRRNYAMAYDSKRDAVVLFGGYNGDYLGDTWEY